MVTTTWYSQACDLSGCADPVVVSIDQSLVTECDWTSGARVDNANCGPSVGEVPIVVEIPEPLDLIMGENRLDAAGTQKLRELLYEFLAEDCIYSEIFNRMTSNNVKIDFGYDPANTGSGGYNPQTGEITFPNINSMSIGSFREEMIHAFQDNFYSGGIYQYLNVGFSNIEFEAKFLVDITNTLNDSPTCCVAFVNPTSPEAETLRLEFTIWLYEITNNGTTFPDFNNIQQDYFQWLEKFKSVNPRYNRPTNPNLMPNAAFSVATSCN